MNLPTPPSWRKAKNNSLWLQALSFRLIKVVFPLRLLCWVGGCTLIALPEESCAPVALSSFCLTCWSRGVIPKHMALLGRTLSLWSQGEDSSSPMYCGLWLGVQLLWCMDHFQGHSSPVLNNRLCSQMNLWCSLVGSKRLDSIFHFFFYFLNFPLGWLIWSVVHTHTNLSKWFVCHTLTVLFGTYFLVFCNVDRLRIFKIFIIWVLSLMSTFILLSALRKNQAPPSTFNGNFLS